MRRWWLEAGGSVGKDIEKDKASLSQSAGRGQQRQGLQREGHAVSQEEEERREIHGRSCLGGRRRVEGSPVRQGSITHVIVIRRDWMDEVWDLLSSAETQRRFSSFLAQSKNKRVRLSGYC